jgi:hypothetical protein
LEVSNSSSESDEGTGSNFGADDEDDGPMSEADKATLEQMMQAISEGRDPIEAALPQDVGRLGENIPAAEESGNASRGLQSGDSPAENDGGGRSFTANSKSTSEPGPEVRNGKPKYEAKPFSIEVRKAYLSDIFNRYNV